MSIINTQSTDITATRSCFGIPVSWAKRGNAAEAILASGLLANGGTDHLSLEDSDGNALPREELETAVRTLVVAAWHAAKDAGLDPEVVRTLDRAIEKLDADL